MAYSKAHFDLCSPSGQSTFHENLHLKNIGVSIHVFQRGEGFDFFHNHREQEEVYLCLSGRAMLKIGGDSPEDIALEAGDIVRVDPSALRAIGNTDSDRATVLIAGGCLSLAKPFQGLLELFDRFTEVFQDAFVVDLLADLVGVDLALDFGFQFVKAAFQAIDGDGY